MPTTPSTSPDPTARIAALEARIARLEACVGLGGSNPESTLPNPLRQLTRSSDALELEVGQNWFGPVGITVLAAAGGFMLTLPYPDAPAIVPSLGGWLSAGLLYAIAHFGRNSFALVSSYLRGAAMALLYGATLRLFFFGHPPVLRADSPLGTLALTAASGANLGIAWRRRSPPLMSIAFLTAAATPLAIGTPAAVFIGVITLAVSAALAAARLGWHVLLIEGSVLTIVTYQLWAMGNLQLGHAYHWAPSPALAPCVVLACLVIIGSVPLYSRNAQADGAAMVAAALVNCLLGYGAFWLHTFAVGTAGYALLHGVAAAVFLGFAAALWVRQRSQFSTFVYAMCGYAALSVAIVHVAPLPDVLVWLSAESVVVVGTAIWFQSRFIVVTNFLIYVLVVLGYMALNERETGVSIGFGIVALVSARVLNWQKHRLALKTELMRNAYLVSAFVVFPYALYHLVRPEFRALAWVALAVVYYGLNRIIRNQKYRWMGHGTLLATAAYLVIPSHAGLTPAYRIASFVALGAAFLVVSLTTTRAHRRSSAAAATQRAADSVLAPSDGSSR